MRTKYFNTYIKIRKDQDLPLPTILVPPPTTKFKQRDAQLIEKKMFPIKFGSLPSSNHNHRQGNLAFLSHISGNSCTCASSQALVPCEEAAPYQSESLYVYLQTLKYFPTNSKLVITEMSYNYKAPRSVLWEG